MERDPKKQWKRQLNEAIVKEWIGGACSFCGTKKGKACTDCKRRHLLDLLVKGTLRYSPDMAQFYEGASVSLHYTFEKFLLTQLEAGKIKFTLQVAKLFTSYDKAKLIQSVIKGKLNRMEVKS